MLKAQEVLFEIAVSFLIGGLPVLIAYWIGGFPFLDASLKALLPNDFPLWYAVGLSGITVAVLSALKISPSLSGPSLPKKILLEVHSDLHAVYRLGAGALLTFSALWVCVDRASLHRGILLLIIYGLASLLVCIFYGRLTQWLEDRASSTAA
ncbi:hypothetical protein H9L17_04910 [Thermomonas brevis]|uniref:Uncharacterized protein n=1 Tax=Thermomonas brevis TaxID=215691 RepID=A0A7G9QVV6_9GAMM|nr:hypothetical protein [Thermomonas brevis]QNN47481.1 hypothetical protein H9L17_04910 [Thermomonas brevis]